MATGVGTGAGVGVGKGEGGTVVGCPEGDKAGVDAGVLEGT